MDGGRPRISPETARLLRVLTIALVVLWALARVRFPERAAAANPVAPVLAQLSPDPPLVGIVNTIETLLPSVQPIITPITWRSSDGSAIVRPALRFRDDLAALIAPASAGAADTGTLVASDPGTRLTVLRLDQVARAAPAVRVATGARDAIQYVFSTEVSAGELMLRPVLTGPSAPVPWPGWRDRATPLPDAAVPPGAYVFNGDGSLAGIAVTGPGGLALVSAEALLARANALALRGPRGRVDLGVAVQPLTSSLQAALGTNAALAISWVDPDGPSAWQLATGDAVEELDGVTIDSLATWNSTVAEHVAFDTVHVKAQRGGESVDAWITAAPVAAAALATGDAHPLGLTLRRVGTGAQVVRVDAGSAGERAGIRPDDVIVRVGDAAMPSPSQVVEEFSRSGEGRPLLAVVARGNGQLLAAFDRIW